LLTLDGEERMLLTRIAETPPTARELAARYNARAFEALLANAAEVEWRITPADRTYGEGLGSVVKRVCFLARRMGVHYDVAFDGTGGRPEHESLPTVAESRALYTAPPGGAVDSMQSLDRSGRPVVVTLFGPQSLTGSPIQYGDRLVRLCRALLGYRREDSAHGQAALATTELQGMARVQLNGRPLLFPLDERLLKQLRGEAPADTVDAPAVGAGE